MKLTHLVAALIVAALVFTAKPTSMTRPAPKAAVVQTIAIPPFRGAVLFDITASRDEARIAASLDDFEPLFDRLRISGGEIGFGLIREDSDHPLTRCYIPAPPDAPALSPPPLAARETAPAILLVGPAGCGKTTLAQGLAAHFKGKCKILIAAKDVTPLLLCGLLAAIEFGDTLFIDEAHALTSASQELLYPVIDFLKRPVIRDGKLDRSERASVAPFNLICATTEPGRLLAPFRSRMDIQWFDPNTSLELRDIAIAKAAKAGTKLTPQAARELAKRCQRSPRIVERLVQQLKRLTPGVHELNQGHVEIFLRKKGISSHGLDPLQQQYLLALARIPGKRSMFERLAAHLPGADAAFIRQEAEPFLVTMGAIVIESRSRLLTQKGEEIVAELKAQ